MKREEVKQKSHRPFKDLDECWNEMLKHQPFGWVKIILSNNNANITTINNLGIYLYHVYYADKFISYYGSFEQLTFIDGSPFGINEK